MGFQGRVRRWKARLCQSPPALAAAIRRLDWATLCHPRPQSRVASVKIISFNANGLRSAASKGFFDWLPAAGHRRGLRAGNQGAGAPAAGRGDCCRPAITRTSATRPRRRATAASASTPGASPTRCATALGWAPFDDEGRYIEARFGNLSVVSLYLPSGSSGDERQQFKFEVMEWFAPILGQWLHSGRDYVICGDWNIVHTRKDIRNWTSNQKNSGCLPEERAWLDRLFQRRRLGRQLPPPAARRRGLHLVEPARRGARQERRLAHRLPGGHAVAARAPERLRDPSRAEAFPTTRPIAVEYA